MAIEKSEVKELAKTALKATGEVQFPDLLMYIAQKLIGPVLHEVIEDLEAKGMVTIADSNMGAIITKTSKPKEPEAVAASQAEVKTKKKKKKKGAKK
jgi:hypothetical protein